MTPPNFPYTLPYNFNNGTYGGGGVTYDAGSTASGSGAITATFTWSDPNQPPPQSAIVIENCTVYALAGGGVTGSCSTGFSGAGQSSSSGGTIVGTQYTGRSNPGASFTVQDTPSASSTPGPAQTGDASVSYSASASPVTINLTGAKQDSSGKWDILVGQGCSASLAGIPSNCTTSGWQWNVGGTTFQSWSGSTNASSYVDGPGPLTNPTAHWYWHDSGNGTKTTETISCTATVTPSAGQGSPFTVTAQKKVNVYVPAWTATGTGGYMQVNAHVSLPGQQNGQVYFYAGPNNGQAGGMNWDATVTTPPQPAFGAGKLELVQIATPNVSYITNTTPSQTHTDPENGLIGLDTQCPYYGIVYSEGTSHFTINDSPLLGVQSTTASATLNDQFYDYLMYQPPGADVQWVPLATFNWNTAGSAVIPTTGNWADYATQHNGSDVAGTVTPSTPTPFTATSTFPAWTRTDVFPAF